MDALVTGKRLLKLVAAVAAAALLVVGTVWTMGWLGLDRLDSGVEYPADPGPADPIAAEDVHDVAVDLDVPVFDFDNAGNIGNDIRITVDNGFGTEIPGIAIDVVIEDPGGDYPPMYLAASTGHKECVYEFDEEDPGEVVQDNVDQECLRRQVEGEEECTLSADDFYAEYLEPLSRHARCIHAVDVGENYYGFRFRLPIAIEYGEPAPPDYPELNVSAELSIDGEVFASDDETLTTVYPED